MSKIKRAIEIDEQTSEDDIPVWYFVNDNKVPAFDFALEKAQKEYELSKYSDVELLAELQRRNKDA